MSISRHSKIYKLKKRNNYNVYFGCKEVLTVYEVPLN